MRRRSSGVLMHITSLPGKQGIGTFGKSAYDFVDFLEETQQTYWQLLPLTTTSYGDSPYQSFSAVAGNLNLIDFDLLEEEGLLEKVDYEGVNFGDNLEKVDYGLLFDVRRPILEKAVANVVKSDKVLAEIEKFEKENASWLVDYAEYMAIKESRLEGSDIILPSAQYMLELALTDYAQNKVISALEIEPVYLRNEVTWKKLPGRE